MTGTLQDTGIPRPGERFGKYLILARLGRGGMAVVYRAREDALDRDVALKIIDSTLTADPSFAQRFDQEARLAASVKHPNVVVVYACGDEAGRRYIAMEYVGGGSLAESIRLRGILPLRETLATLSQIGSALDYAHRLNVVHRDVKPANILLEHDSGRALLADFGIARTLDATTTLTRPGLTLGTATYMAPEQAEGIPVGPAADRYAFGIVAYELLAGRPPFRGDTWSALAAQHLTAIPPTIRTFRPDLPERVDRVLFRMLAKAPQDRYPSTLEFGADLEQALRGTAEPVRVAIRPDHARSRGGPRRKQTSLIAATAGLALGAVTLGASLILVGPHPELHSDPTRIPGPARVSTSAPTAIAAVTAVPSPLPTPATAPAATQAVADFYAAIGRHDLDTAYSLLGHDEQQRVTRNDLANRYDGVISVAMQRAPELQEQSTDRAIVAVAPLITYQWAEGGSQWMFVLDWSERWRVQLESDGVWRLADRLDSRIGNGILSNTVGEALEAVSNYAKQLVLALWTRRPEVMLQVANGAVRDAVSSRVAELQAQDTRRDLRLTSFSACGFQQQGDADHVQLTATISWMAVDYQGSEDRTKGEIKPYTERSVFSLVRRTGRLVVDDIKTDGSSPQIHGCQEA